MNAEQTGDLRLRLLPLDIAYSDPEANLDAVESAAASFAGSTDLLVLPELFSTGFIRKPEKLLALAETNDGPTMSAVMSMARNCDMAIAGSFLATDGNGRFFNRAFFISPDGSSVFYDKRHLFTYSGEHKILTPGENESPVIVYRGWRIRMMVCYDLRFPCWCRNRKLAYDLMLLPANWPVQREYAFRQLLIARAIENQAYVAGADRSGSDPMGDYPEAMSQIYDFNGQPMGQCAVLSRVALDEARLSFPVYLDADC